MKRGTVLLVLLVAGCGGTAPKAHRDTEPGGNVQLQAICPGAHQVYDGLVASNPASQSAFVQHLEDLRTVADSEARSALDPVIQAAKDLASAGRGSDFSTAQDAMYQSVVGLDADCRENGSYILH